MSEQRPRVCVLLHPGTRQSLVSPWLDSLSTPVEVVEQYDEDWSPPDTAALVVTCNHYQVRDRQLLRRLQQEGRVAVLILADGILEYRNTWDHPALPPGALFQPVLGHKMACLGRSQIRTLEAWGNIGRCELVGLPCLDALQGRRPRVRPKGDPFRILVATARTPGFTERQRSLVRRSLADLRYWHRLHPRSGDQPIELVWRLTGEIEASLGLPNAGKLAASRPLAGVLESVDAVVTTPSSLQLEAMLHGLPLALLDYTNSPAYVPAAWSITAPRHLEAVLPELVNPPAPRRLYQDTILHDALECRSPAADRMCELVEAMCTAVEISRSSGTELRFPARILAPQDAGGAPPDSSHDLAALFPEASALRESDLTRLQQRVADLEHLSKQMPEVEAARARFEAEARDWRRRYQRLAGIPPLQQLLWVRQWLEARRAH